MKNQKLILLLCLLMTCIMGKAQQFKITSFEQSVNDLYARTHERLDSLGDPCAVIRISVVNPEDFHFKGIVGEPIYDEGEVIVYLPQGSEKLEMTVSKKYHTFKMETLEKRTVYLMNIQRESLAAQRTRMLVIPSLWAQSNEFHVWGLGIMVGFVKRFGAYVKGTTDIFGDYKHLASADYKSDNTGKTPNNEQLLFNERRANYRSNFSVTGGGIIRLKPMTYIYMGLGYVSDRVGTTTMDNLVTEISNYTTKGLAAETGLMFRIGKMGLTFGCETNQFKYYKISVGVGVVF